MTSFESFKDNSIIENFIILITDVSIAVIRIFNLSAKQTPKENLKNLHVQIYKNLVQQWVQQVVQNLRHVFSYRYILF